MRYTCIRCGWENAHQDDCPKSPYARTFKEQQEDLSFKPPIDREMAEMGDYFFTGGMTEYEFFGGDLGDFG